MDPNRVIMSILYKNKAETLQIYVDWQLIYILLHYTSPQNTWQVHNGKCGICGDDFGLPTPRPHEFGGEYGSGDIIRVYKAGTDIPITANLTANHRGYFTFDICNMDYSDETEECFIKLKIEDGSDRFYLPSPESGTYHTAVFIPRYMVCDHCVLRWQYTAGQYRKLDAFRSNL